MKLNIYIMALLLLFSAGMAAGQQAKPAVMTNANVIKLHKAGLEDDIILSRIESATCKFDLLDDGLIALKKEGVSDRIIKAMMDRGQGKKASDAPLTSDVKTDKPTTAARPALPDPQIMNAIFSYDRVSRNMKALEKSNATQKAHKGGMGFGATTYTCEIDGDKSATRLSPDNAASFVVNTGGTPPDAITLFKVEAAKKRRIATTSKITGLGSMKGAQGAIACNITMLKAGVYEIAPEIKLDKGEYFFTTKKLDYTTMANMDVYAFGID